MTHRKETLDAVKTNNLVSLIETDEFKNCDIVGIDEGQFFDDLLETKQKPKFIIKLL